MTRLHSVEKCSRWIESIALIVNLEYRDGIGFLTFNHDPGRSESSRKGHRHAHNFHIRPFLLPPQLNPVSAHPSIGCGCLVNTASDHCFDDVPRVRNSVPSLHRHHRGNGTIDSDVVPRARTKNCIKRSLRARSDPSLRYLTTTITQPTTLRPLAAEPWGHHTSGLTTCPSSSTPTSNSHHQSTIGPGHCRAAHTYHHPFYRQFFPSSQRPRPWQRQSISPGCSILATRAPGDIPSMPPTSPSSLPYRP
jgi:hypothetical protein